MTPTIEDKVNENVVYVTMEPMTIKFHGVGGSVPAPSSDQRGFYRDAFGSNTSCVEVYNSLDDRIILDGGSGMRELGIDLVKNKGYGQGKKQAAILFSHTHWDHIQGFPFFKPAFQKSNTFYIFGLCNVDKSLEQVLEGQMEHQYFPVKLKDMGALMTFRSLQGGEHISYARFGIDTVKLNHPGGVLSYRINCMNNSIVYATDNEPNEDNDAKLVEHAKNADILIYDSQYTPQEYEGKESTYEGIPPCPRKGWGHSTYMHGVEVALRANVSELILFHHEPEHDDKKLHQIEELAKSYMTQRLIEEGRNPGEIMVYLAREGMEVSTGPRKHYESNQTINAG